MVLENSIEEFIERFRSDAAQGILYPQPEGSVLLEFVAGGQVMYLFDRTGPYIAKPGPARVIVHPVLSTLTPTEQQEEVLAVSQISALEGVGRVSRTEKGFVIVQARIPLVCGMLDHEVPGIKTGDWVSFSTLPPTHGFYLLK
ncbi:hypothetical protein [Deinococcus cellulosilyticus]|uniref:Uncharacterized protein n=1 Tax=Deinococcus cellulosilyticus (strain DSM 18568 / NBRC 106333 / KACC 11606 / 5516J-15) TaxID=1223518 RepID=A0A511MZR5_DEIC1|nr:hypothetical protein [Deinococcus cellulosilyticus]GEM45821.1 hypothetical protein DC3_14560 [Deinococcus cellulosilyticus NBRC 106333 = KACC 11606]